MPKSFITHSYSKCSEVRTIISSVAILSWQFKSFKFPVPPVRPLRLQKGKSLLSGPLLSLFQSSCLTNRLLFHFSAVPYGSSKEQQPIVGTILAFFISGIGKLIMEQLNCLRLLISFCSSGCKEQKTVAVCLQAQEEARVTLASNLFENTVFFQNQKYHNYF